MRIKMTGHSTGATREEMAANLVPIHVRDNCAGVLIPLNKYVPLQTFSPNTVVSLLINLSRLYLDAGELTYICPGIARRRDTRMRYACTRSMRSVGRSRKTEVTKSG
ncbi:hypothetical protein EON64_05890 [archaeon]|nr:MAG: hypothetical protein EON64_05890 [archaeon]